MHGRAVMCVGEVYCMVGWCTVCYGGVRYTVWYGGVLYARAVYYVLGRCTVC